MPGGQVCDDREPDGSGTIGLPRTVSFKFYRFDVKLPEGTVFQKKKGISKCIDFQVKYVSLPKTRTCRNSMKNSWA